LDLLREATAGETRQVVAGAVTSPAAATHNELRHVIVQLTSPRDVSLQRTTARSPSPSNDTQPPGGATGRGHPNAENRLKIIIEFKL